MWTVGIYDDYNTVFAMTDITVDNQTVKYIYFGTMHFDAAGEKISSATPHYLSIGSLVLGNDGYCSAFLDLFD